VPLQLRNGDRDLFADANLCVWPNAQRPRDEQEQRAKLLESRRRCVTLQNRTLIVAGQNYNKVRHVFDAADASRSVG
jgi:hypothetical protein